MKITIFSPVAALLVAGAIALPAPIPTTSVHVPVSQDPSPAASFPKYALIKGNPLEERRIPSALSRFPTDNEDEVNDPSPPRPFPPGHPVETNGSSAGNVSEPRTPSPALRNTEGMIYPIGPINLDKCFKYDDGSIHPEALLFGCPVVTPPERPVISKATVTLPVPHTPEGSIVPEGPVYDSRPTKISDPSPPMPFAPGHPVEANTSTSIPTIVPRIPDTALLGPGDSDNATTINDPSPPRPFPPGHPVTAEPQGHREFRPDHAHGGYFPPSNPAVAEPTASTDSIVEVATAAPVKRSCGKYVAECRQPNRIPMPTSVSNSTSTTPLPTALIPNVIQPLRIPVVSLPRPQKSNDMRPDHRIPFATAFIPIMPRPINHHGTNKTTTNGTSAATFTNITSTAIAANNTSSATATNLTSTAIATNLTSTANATNITSIAIAIAKNITSTSDVIGGVVRYIIGLWIRMDGDMDG